MVLLMGECDEQVKSDIKEIKQKFDEIKARDEKLELKIVSMENKINNGNKWVIVLCIIAILAVTCVALTVLIRSKL